MESELLSSILLVKISTYFGIFFLSGSDLFSQNVAIQVSSALHRFTSVFGMGTGGTNALKPPEFYSIKKKTNYLIKNTLITDEPLLNVRNKDVLNLQPKKIVFWGSDKNIENYIKK